MISSLFQGKNIFIFIALLCIAFIFVMLLGGPKSTREYLDIRLENATGQDIENFWLGAGPEGGSTQDTKYSNLAAGSVSRYQQIENVTKNYSKANLVIDQKRYSVTNITDTLESNKSYTFKIVENNDEFEIEVSY